jgi:hypothetical protein
MSLYDTLGRTPWFPITFSYQRLFARSAKGLIGGSERGLARSEGKLLSLFEPSTEVIRKGKAGKPNEFGKMVKSQEAENQIITDYEVYARRPYDSDLLVAAIDRRNRRNLFGGSR